MKNKIYVLTLVFIMLFSSVGFVSAQKRKEKNEKTHKFIRFFPKERIGYQKVAYNFFTVGPNTDSKMFETTVNGFGSGFVFDIFSFRSDLDMIAIGTEHVFLTSGVGLAIMKFRFSNNLVMQYENNNVVVGYDQNPDHQFSNSFFGHDKTKLVYGSVYVPVRLNIKLGDFALLSGGSFVDLYLSGKFKRKFRENGEKKKEVIRNKDFKNFNINKTKFGWNAEIRLLKYGLGFGYIQMFTPFFSGKNDPEIYENRAYLLLNIGKLLKL